MDVCERWNRCVDVNANSLGVYAVRVVAAWSTSLYWSREARSRETAGDGVWFVGLMKKERQKDGKRRATGKGDVEVSVRR